MQRERERELRLWPTFSDGIMRLSLTINISGDLNHAACVMSDTGGVLRIFPKIVKSWDFEIMCSAASTFWANPSDIYIFFSFFKCKLPACKIYI